MDAVATAEDLEARLRALGRTERAIHEQAYLKLPGWTFFGVKVPEIRALAKAWLKERADLDRAGLWAVVDALWGPEVYERRALATHLLVERWRWLEPQDGDRLAALLAASRTWALVDNLAVPGVGRAVGRAPDAWGPVLDGWAAHPDFWVRRAALLALLRPLRTGGGDWARFTRYADGMLDDREFFIAKAIGWVLREAGAKDPHRVADWLTPRAARAQALTVREATRRLPPELRDRVRASRGG